HSIAAFTSGFAQRISGCKRCARQWFRLCSPQIFPVAFSKSHDAVLVAGGLSMRLIPLGWPAIRYVVIATLCAYALGAAFLQVVQAQQLRSVTDGVQICT